MLQRVMLKPVHTAGQARRIFLKNVCSCVERCISTYHRRLLVSVGANTMAAEGVRTVFFSGLGAYDYARKRIRTTGCIA